MSIPGLERHHRANMLIKQFGLTEVADSQGRFLSGGERRKLEIARAMITEPSLILLDEPFSGVDPITVARIAGGNTPAGRLRREHISHRPQRGKDP